MHSLIFNYAVIIARSDACIQHIHRVRAKERAAESEWEKLNDEKKTTAHNTHYYEDKRENCE